MCFIWLWLACQARDGAKMLCPYWSKVLFPSLLYVEKNLKNILLFEILTSRVNKYQIALCDRLDIGQENLEFKSWLYVDEHPYF